MWYVSAGVGNIEVRSNNLHTIMKWLEIKRHLDDVCETLSPS